MKRCFVVIAAFFIANGCGVHVGNGMQSYRSSHGFKVEYSAELTLKEKTDGVGVTIDNQKLVGEDSQRVSSASFTVEERSSIRTVTELEEMARREHYSYGTSYQRKEISGGIGIVSEMSEGSLTMRTAYFLMTGTNTLVRAHVVAYPEGRGKELIAPIVDSFQGVN